jgi:hypothetical protein
MTNGEAQLCGLVSFARALELGSFDATACATHAPFRNVRFTFRNLDRPAGGIGVARWRRLRLRVAQSGVPQPERWLRAKVMSGGRFELVYFPYDATLAEPEMRLRERTGGSSGGWMLRVRYVDRSELWCPEVEFTGRWELSPSGRSLRHVGPPSWHASYFGTTTSPVDDATKSIESRTLELRAALERTAAFARTHAAAEHWLPVFHDALARLESDDPEGGLRLPPAAWPHAYPLLNRRLFASAQAADVFGGMGSWNDQQYADDPVQAQVGSLGRELWSAYVNAILAAVNAS